MKFNILKTVRPRSGSDLPGKFAKLRMKVVGQVEGLEAARAAIKDTDLLIEVYGEI